MQASMEQYVLSNEEMSTEVIADGIHLSDDLLRFAYHMIGFRRTCLVSDSNRALDASPGKYRFGSNEDGTWVYSDGQSVKGEDGSLASSMHGMDRMVKIILTFSTRGVHEPGRRSKWTSWSKSLHYRSDVLILLQELSTRADARWWLVR